MEWLWGLGLLATCLGVGCLWQVASDARGPVGTITRAMESLVESAENLLAVALGVGLILLGLATVLLPWAEGDLRWLGGPILIGSGIWIVWATNA